MRRNIMGRPTGCVRRDNNANNWIPPGRKLASWPYYLKVSDCTRTAFAKAVRGRDAKNLLREFERRRETDLGGCKKMLLIASAYYNLWLTQQVNEMIPYTSYKKRL